MIAILPATVSPRFVARLSALPMASVEALSSDALRSALVEFAAVTVQLKNTADGASELLYAMVSEATDPVIRTALIRLRRDLFNMRQPRGQDLNAAFNHMSPEECAIIQQNAALLDRRASAYQRVRESSVTALSDARNRIRNVLRDDRFAHGVLLSSPALHGNFARYARLTNHPPKAREVQVERGILRYLTRAAAKATPFGSFCKVASGHIVCATYDPANPPPLYTAHGSWNDGPRVVRLNKLLYVTLWSALRERPAVRAALSVELNPTLKAENDSSLFFIANTEERELIQRLEIGDAVLAVVRLMQERENIALASLVDAMSHDETIDATVEEATAFVNALVEFGLLRFRSPVRSQDADWTEGLRTLIENIDDEIAAQVRQFLLLATEVTHLYATASTNERAALSNQLGLAVNKVLRAAGRAPEDFTELLLLEDCGADGGVNIPATRDITAALETLSHVVQRLLPMAYPRADMAALRHYYNSRYADRHSGVPLLELYEAYYRDHLKDHLALATKRMLGQIDPEASGYDHANPFALPLVAELRNSARAWTELIRTRWSEQSDAEQIDIPLSDCPGTDLMSSDPSTDPRSVSIFCQLAGDARSVKLVVPDARILLGFGKYYSRFLHVLPEEFTQHVREENADVGRDQVAEIAGDANHNANLHPPLLGREIAYPTDDGDPAAGSIPWNDCVVVPDPDDANSVALRYGPDRSRIYPIDLGFLNPLLRPALFRFLMTFSPRSAMGVVLPSNLDARKRPADDRVVYRPRIVIGGHVVVARRTWTVPAAQYPRRQADELLHDYLIRIYQWRTQLNIPARVYVRIQPHAPARVAEIDATPAEPHSVFEADAGVGATVAETTVDEAGTDPAANAISKIVLQSARPSTVAPRSSRDYRKPQFIDLDSPVLVDLFSRVPGPLLAFTATIEEQYPTSDQLPQLHGQAHAVELVLQMHFSVGVP